MGRPLFRAAASRRTALMSPPAGVEMKGRVVIGSRSDAELQARVLIDSWLNPRKVLRASSFVSSLAADRSSSK